MPEEKNMGVDAAAHHGKFRCATCRWAPSEFKVENPPEHREPCPYHISLGVIRDVEITPNTFPCQNYNAPSEAEKHAVLERITVALESHMPLGYEPSAFQRKPGG